MRKQTKKLLSWVLTGALALGLVGNVNVATVGADDAANTETALPTNSAVATLAYGSADWSFGHWDPNTENGEDAIITQDGTYTVSISNPATANSYDLSNVFCVDIVGIWNKVADPEALQVSDVKVKADGDDVTVDQEKIVAGHLEDNKQNYRIELYNAQNKGTPSTIDNPPIDTTTTWSETLEVTFTLTGTGWEAPRNTVIDKELWATPGMHAYLSYQMNGTWDYRNGYNPGKKFADGDSHEFIKDGGHPDGAPDGSGVVATDVLLTKDGTYTIGIDGIDLSASSKFNLLSIATDLKGTTYPGIEVTDVTMKVDGQDVTSEAIDKLNWKNDDTDFYYMPLINSYNDGSDPENPVPPLNAVNEAEELAIPTQSMEVSFKVTGLKKALQDLKDGNYVDPVTGEKVKNESITDEDIAGSADNSGSQPTGEPTGQPTGQPTSQPTVKPSTQPTKAPVKTTAPAKKGAKLTSGKLVYKVTKAAAGKKAGTLTVTALSKSGKKAGKLSIPATATIKGYKYNVTKLGNNVFKGAKAKSITLGKNIKAIPKGAFAKCTKLSTLTIKAKKLSSVKKGAFKGCKKTIKVKGGSKKTRKANVKKLKKSGYKKFK